MSLSSSELRELAALRRFRFSVLRALDAGSSRHITLLVTTLSLSSSHHDDTLQELATLRRFRFSVTTLRRAIESRPPSSRRIALLKTALRRAEATYVIDLLSISNIDLNA